GAGALARRPGQRGRISAGPARERTEAARRAGAAFRARQRPRAFDPDRAPAEGSQRGARLSGGVLLVAKPAGPTSHDVVDRARRALGISRVGYLGTLDPFAEGLLVLVTERATRLAAF